MNLEARLNAQAERNKWVLGRTIDLGTKGNGLVKLYAVGLLVLVGVTGAAHAAKPQTIVCRDLKGATMEYGVPMADRVKQLATADNRAPRFRYVPAYADGYSGTTITFLLDPDKQAVTVMWGLSAADVAANHEAASVAHVKAPFEQPEPFTAGIVDYMPGTVIVALKNDGLAVTTYSFFPSLASVFITSTTFVPGKSPNSIVTTVRGACDFSSGG